MSLRSPDIGTSAPPPEGGPGGSSAARWAALAAVGLLLASAVVVGVVRTRGGEGGEGIPIRPGTVGQGTTVPVALSAEQPPALLNTGDDPDWDGMVRSMRAFDDWLRVHPRPELLGEWIRKESPSFAEGQAALRNFADGTWRYEPAYQPLSIERVSLISRHGPSAVVFVRYGPTGPTRVVDRSGKEVYGEPAKDARSVAWTVIRDSDGHWRFEKADYL